MKPSNKSMDQVSMLSKVVRLGLGWILMAALAGAAQAGIILTYQEGLNGYTGTDDSAIIGLHPRGDAEMVAISGQTTMGVNYQNKPCRVVFKTAFLCVSKIALFTGGWDSW